MLRERKRTDCIIQLLKLYMFSLPPAVERRRNYFEKQNKNKSIELATLLGDCAVIDVGHDLVGASGYNMECKPFL